MPMSTIHRRQQVSGFFRRCITGRADIAIIGDSNTFAAGDSGNVVGFERAWGERLGLYATPVRLCRATDGWNLGYYSDSAVFHGLGAVPAPYDAYVPSVAFGKYGYYVTTAELNNGFFGDKLTLIKVGHPNSIDATMEWHVQHGTFASGGGIIKPTMRVEIGLTYYGVDGSIDTNTGTVGTAISTHTIPAVSKSGNNVAFTTARYFNEGGSTGPFVGLYNRVTWPDVLTGVGVSALLYQGGYGTRDAAEQLIGMTQTQFTTWAAMVVTAQSGRPTLMIQVLQGANDSNGGSAASLGPAQVASNTAAGVADNTAAVVA